jgi:LPXTG-motif cell wall-anchored protein
MAGQLEKNSSRLMVGLTAVVLGVVLLFAPAALAQDDSDAYPPSSSSTSSSTSTSSTSTTDTSVTPSSVQRSTISRDPGSTTLPRTGNDVLPWALTGLVLVAVGGGIIYLTRRSKATAA